MSVMSKQLMEKVKELESAQSKIQINKMAFSSSKMAAPALAASNMTNTRKIFRKAYKKAGSKQIGKKIMKKATKTVTKKALQD
ncbi:hypothetical protein FGO68_gene5023 [Halteria grandinella]|uniref:Uncharacterized protein n=1 Tax=Halteria grandinella TaxID=5974 RepID=A0A8J8T0Z3_HALGN|nr:hypothetical protein FGO68_gene5023 [Halteria grandinella]